MSGMPSLSAMLDDATRILAAAGVDSPRLDAEYLAAHVLGGERRDLRRRLAQPLDHSEAGTFTALVTRRAAREPLQRILGTWEFWGLELGLGPDTLIPRADTETLVEAVLRRRPDRTAALRILDLGTGTGAILLALLHEYPNARGHGVDISDGAVAIARENGIALNLSVRATFSVGNWADGLAGMFDVVAANPPYIPSGTIDGLQPEVARHEPRRALDGGTDGLAPYHRIAAALPGLLRPGGLVLLEHGHDQDAAVRDILVGAGLRSVETLYDLGGNPRVGLGIGPDPAGDRAER